MRRARRATLERWLVEAPAYVLDCFDNKGKTCGRYLVLFCQGDDTELIERRQVLALGMSDNPASPQGFSQFYEVSSAYRPAYERVRWLDLPKHIREHIIERWEE